MLLAIRIDVDAVPIIAGDRGVLDIPLRAPKVVRAQRRVILRIAVRRWS